MSELNEITAELRKQTINAFDKIAEKLKKFKLASELILAKVDEVKKQKEWPQNDECYKLDSDGKIREYDYSELEHEENVLLNGNLFKTEELAQAARLQRMAEAEVLRRLRQLEPEGWEPNFGSCLHNYGPSYNYHYNKIEIIGGNNTQFCNITWLSSQQAWEQVIEEIPEAIMAMLGVEEELERTMENC